jgi:hypothetical protein
MGATRTSITRAGAIPSRTSASTAAMLTPLPASSNRRKASSTSTSLWRAAKCKIPRYSRADRPEAVAAN